MKNLLLLTVSILALSQAAAAYPRMTWYYLNGHATCQTECTRSIGGVCVSKTEVCNRRNKVWQSSHQNVVQEAMNLLTTRIGQRSVERCIDRNVEWYSGIYAPQGRLGSQAWKDFDALKESNTWPAINFHADRYEYKTGGHAILERRAFESSGYVHSNSVVSITLNLAAIDYWVNNYSARRAAEVFAGIIFHEFLHQMGHDHPDTGNYDQDYEQGHFVVVAGDCIESSGGAARSPRTPGSSLVGRGLSNIRG